MSKTRLDVVVRALNILGAVGSDQPASASDTTLVEGLLDATIQELAARGVVYIQDPGVAGNYKSGNIDDAFYIPLALALAKAAASDFGKVGQDLSDSYSQAADGENRLRAMQDAEDDSDEPISFRAY